jgi:hypothetical protein
MPLVEEGFAASLTEAATRFAVSHPAMGTILVGMATPQQLEDALAAVQKGSLPPVALGRLTVLPAGIRRRTTVIAEIADRGTMLTLRFAAWHRSDPRTATAP